MSKEVSCGIDFMRGLLLFFNVLFLIAGVILIGFGIYIKVDNNFASILSELTKNSTFEVQSLGFLAFVMIGGGVFTLIIALLGCMGTLWTNRCLLFTYAVILGILMIIELTGLIMAFAYKGKLTEVYQTALFNVLDSGLKNNVTTVIKSFQDLENAMKCCGVYSISDYARYNFTQYSDWCERNPLSKGCSVAIIDLLSKNLPIIGISLGVVLFMEFVGLLGAVVLAVALKHANNEDFSSNPGEVIKSTVSGRRHNYY